MRFLPLFLALALSSCAKNQVQAPTWEEEDKSIRFPKFHERSTVQVGKEDHVYVMDGETLRAINIAASDFIQPSAKHGKCWETREGHQYRFARQGDIIFVEVYLDPFYCEMPFMLFDYGVKYAISTDGRILRRLYEGEPEDWSTPATEDAGERGSQYEVDPSRLGQIDAPVDCDFLRMLARSPRYKSSKPLPEVCQTDGGTPPPPPQTDGGSPPAP